MTWQQREQMKPIRHDHVGSMHFGEAVCYCHGCGQRWVMTGRGWQALDEGEPDPEELHELRAAVRASARRDG